MGPPATPKMDHYQGKSLSGRKVMDWFNQKTSVAGIQIPNWAIVLAGAIIVILLVQNL
jgi:hypothetical protein